MLDIVALLATALLFGGMVSFSTLFAPLVFTQLPGETAGGFIRAIFPWYYLFVIAVSAVAALVFLANDWIGGLLLGTIALGGIVAREGLMPAINRARDAQMAGDATAGRRFDRMHKASVVINAAQIVVAGIALVRLVA